MRTLPRTCPYCEAGCGLELTLDGDRVVDTRGDVRHPASQGYVCVKGASFGRHDHDPDRLERPLVRVGGRLVEVEWDRAFAEVDRRLADVRRRHGDRAVALYSGNPASHTLAGQLYLPWLRDALRPGFVCSAGTLDGMPRLRASAEVFGDPWAVPVPDLDRTDLAVVVGANPVVSNGSGWTAPDLPGRLRRLRQRGGRLVVLDPRRTETADRADLHVPVRPGPDALLLAAVATVLLDRDLVRLRHLEGRVHGRRAGIGVRSLAELSSPASDVIRRREPTTWTSLLKDSERRPSACCCCGCWWGCPSPCTASRSCSAGSVVAGSRARPAGSGRSASATGGPLP